MTDSLMSLVRRHVAAQSLVALGDTPIIFIGMKHLKTADITGSYGVLRVRAAVAIAALMAVLVFVGGANAHHNGETEVPQKTEIEA